MLVIKFCEKKWRHYIPIPSNPRINPLWTKSESVFLRIAPRFPTKHCLLEVPRLRSLVYLLRAPYTLKLNCAVKLCKKNCTKN